VVILMYSDSHKQTDVTLMHSDSHKQTDDGWMTREKLAGGIHVLTSVSDSKALTLYKKYAYSASYNTHGWA
jgi:hypothetical protein